MARRFTETEKWHDVWFRKLDPNAKLVFMYLCDQCDIAGFWEIDTERAAFEIGLPVQAVEDSLDVIGEKIVRNCKHLWIRNFLHHQRNIPLSTANKAHLAIIRRLSEFVGLSEEIAVLLGDLSPLEKSESPLEKSPRGTGIGIGTGKGNGNGNGDVPETRVDEVLTHLNSALGKSGASAFTSGCGLGERLRKGATVEDAKLVIDFKVAEWAEDDKMRQYIRPKTLFGAENFPGYLSEARDWDARGRTSLAQATNAKRPSNAAPFDPGGDAEDMHRALRQEALVRGPGQEGAIAKCHAWEEAHGLDKTDFSKREGV